MNRAMVRVAFVFRAISKPGNANSIAVVGNCPELGEPTQLRQVNPSGVWQAEISIEMEKDAGDNLKVRHQDNQQNLSFGFVFNNQNHATKEVKLKDKDGYRYVVIAEIDANGQTEELKIFPTVCVSICFSTRFSAQNGESVAIVGNCPELGSEILNETVQPGVLNHLINDIWQKKISIEMTKHEGWLKVPGGQNGLQLRFFLATKSNTQVAWSRLTSNGSNVWPRAEDGTRFVITTNGKKEPPIFPLVPTEICFKTKSANGRKTAVVGNCPELGLNQVTQAVHLNHPTDGFRERKIPIEMAKDAQGNLKVPAGTTLSDLAFSLCASNESGEGWDLPDAQRQVPLTLKQNGRKITIESALGDLDFKLFVTATVRFRAFHVTGKDELIAVVGNCCELGDGAEIAKSTAKAQKLERKPREENIWESNLDRNNKIPIRISMIRNINRELKLPNGNDLEFHLALCDYKSKAEKRRDSAHSVPLESIDEKAFTIEAAWDSRVRIFPGSHKISIKIRAERGTEGLVIRGNFYPLGNAGKKELVKQGQEEIWQTEIALPMVKFQDKWQLPTADGGFEPLTLRVEREIPGETWEEMKPTLPCNIAEEDGGGCKFELLCILRPENEREGKNHWVSVQMPLETGLMNRDSIFSLLCNFLKVHLPDAEVSFADVKKKYAQCLVPMIKLDGGYDGRTGGTSAIPHKYHDIWGVRELQYGEELDWNQLPAPGTTRSAIEYMRLRKARGLLGNRNAVCGRLDKKYHQRQGYVSKVLKLGGETNWSKFLDRNYSDTQYKNALVELAKWVQTFYFFDLQRQLTADVSQTLVRVQALILALDKAEQMGSPQTLKQALKPTKDLGENLTSSQVQALDKYGVRVEAGDLTQAQLDALIKSLTKIRNQSLAPSLKEALTGAQAGVLAQILDEAQIENLISALGSDQPEFNDMIALMPQQAAQAMANYTAQTGAAQLADALVAAQAKAMVRKMTRVQTQAVISALNLPDGSIQLKPLISVLTATQAGMVQGLDELNHYNTQIVNSVRSDEAQPSGQRRFQSLISALSLAQKLNAAQTKTLNSVLYRAQAEELSQVLTPAKIQNLIWALNEPKTRRTDLVEALIPAVTRQDAQHFVQCLIQTPGCIRPLSEALIQVQAETLAQVLAPAKMQALIRALSEPQPRVGDLLEALIPAVTPQDAATIAQCVIRTPGCVRPLAEALIQAHSDAVAHVLIQSMSEDQGGCLQNTIGKETVQKFAPALTEADAEALDSYLLLDTARAESLAQALSKAWAQKLAQAQTLVYEVPNKREWCGCLLRQSAAIVRGRMEAALVSKECDVKRSDWYWNWKNHMEVAACWFAVMMAAWQRLKELIEQEEKEGRKIKHTEELNKFRLNLQEPGGPFVPNFYRWK